MKNKFLQYSEFVKTVDEQVYLFKNLWKEKTTALIHGRRGSGKRSLALDIAEEVMAKGHKLVYVMTDMGLYDHEKRVSQLSPMMIYSPQFESLDDKRDYADIVIQGIEEAVREDIAKVFIIDSVTRIAALSFGRNASAAYVMKRLVALQRRLGVSFLVIANDASAATTRSLVNYADAVIPVPDAQRTEKNNDRRDDAPAVRKYSGKESVVNRYSGSGGANRQFLAKHPSR